MPAKKLTIVMLTPMESGGIHGKRVKREFQKNILTMSLLQE